MNHLHGRLALVMASFVLVAVGGCSSPTASEYRGTFDTLANWWTSTPSGVLASADTLRIEITFTNGAGDALDFGSEGGLDVWTIDAADQYIDGVDVTFVARPEVVLDGASFSFEVTLEGASLDDATRKIAVRPIDQTFGTLGPDKITLTSGTIVEE